MSAHESLNGSCSCGRNQYLIRIPTDVTDQAQIYFDTSRDHRRFYGAPLTAWLRVPLSWYQSYTQAYFPDETHSTIRRIFSPSNAPHTKRIFCGFCGTPLTYWTESPREEADYMSVAIGSLLGDQGSLLEDLNLLPEDNAEDSSSSGLGSQQGTGNTGSSSSLVIAPTAGSASGLSTTSYRQGIMDGIPWFEELVEGSRLGRMLKTGRGVGVSADQGTTIEWEISEWTQEDSSSSSGSGTGKRKRATNVGLESTELPRTETECS